VLLISCCLHIELLSKSREVKLEEFGSISGSFRKVVGLLGRLKGESVLLLADTF